jgi:GT2 family glycosyltransferase
MAMSRSPRLFVVTVLYNCPISQSSTYTSLLRQTGHDSKRVSCLLYDNSPTREGLEGSPSTWLSVNDPTNGGLSRAYNCALDEARKQHCEWLLLLDQDTYLPPYFMDELFRVIDAAQASTDVAAIVPTIRMGSRQISPVQPKLFRNIPFKPHNSIAPEWLMAINSATAVRLEFLDSIGGFSNEFWLDYLDHWLFRKIYDSKKKVLVTESQVEHNLSVVNLNIGMTVERYHSILDAEALFTNHYLGSAWRIALTFRLLARSLKHLFITREKKFSIMMFRAATSQMAFFRRDKNEHRLR